MTWVDAYVPEPALPSALPRRHGALTEYSNSKVDVSFPPENSANVVRDPFPVPFDMRRGRRGSEAPVPTMTTTGKLKLTRTGIT